MNKFISTWVFILLPAILASQSNGAIKVYMSDAQTQEAVPFSKVILQKEKRKSLRTIDTMETNMDGESIFKGIPKGKYTIYGTYPGYTLVYIKHIVVKKGLTSYVSLILNYKKDGLSEETYIYTPPITENIKEGQRVVREEYINTCGGRSPRPEVYEAKEDSTAKPK